VEQTDRMARLFNGFVAARRVPSAPASAPDRFRRFFDGYRSVKQLRSLPSSGRGVQFTCFFGEYKSAHGRSARLAFENTERFRIFAESFREARKSWALKANEVSVKQLQVTSTFLNGYSIALQDSEKKHGATGERFEVLEVLGLTRDETKHSRMLAWLLDRNSRKFGTHAQRGLGFRLLLSELGLPTALADTAYSVRREVCGERSRIDIEVASRGHFLLHIEVKIDAAEGREQTSREWVDLLRRAAAIGILDILADDDKDPPLAGIWIQENDAWDYKVAEEAVRNAAKTVLGPEKLPRWRLGDNEYTAVLGRAIASKQEILEMLAKDETDHFVSLRVEHFEELTGFIPAIDSALLKKSEC